ncbi:MAG: hypothetical protein IPO22_19550 [Anaerolineales bacterium]|nr:hypothetical protein [Anaerolineales bacterium]
MAYAQDPTPPTPNGDVQPLAADGTSLYYYVDGQRVNLTPSLDWVSVKFVSTDTVEQQSVTGKFSSTVAPLDGAREIPHLGLTLLPLQDGLGTKNLVQGVNSMRASSSSFSQVNPVYSYDGVDMVVSDEFIAAFPPATSMADIDALNVARGVEVVSLSSGRKTPSSCGSLPLLHWMPLDGQSLSGERHCPVCRPEFCAHCSRRCGRYRRSFCWSDGPPDPDDSITLLISGI